MQYFNKGRLRFHNKVLSQSMVKDGEKRFSKVIASVQHTNEALHFFKIPTSPEVVLLYLKYKNKTRKTRNIVGKTCS